MTKVNIMLSLRSSTLSYARQYILCDVISMITDYY